MYCVKCGVELASSERKCPLCQTKVYYPELSFDQEAPYPEFTGSREEINSRGICFIISFLLAISGVISLFCDFSLNSSVTWCGYVLGGMFLSYTVFILPRWFRHPSPAIFVPVDFAAAALFLLYIDYSVDGGWFLPFALPIIGAVTLIVSSVVILIYYLRRGKLYIFGGASIALGILSVFIEILIHAVFKPHHEYLLWSVYPMLTLVMLGIMLIVIAIVKPIRESLKKIFAL